MPRKVAETGQNTGGSKRFKGGAIRAFRINTWEQEDKRKNLLPN